MAALAAVLTIILAVTARLGFALAQGAKPPKASATAAGPKPKATGWKNVEQLISDQKFQEALDQTDKIRLAAQKSMNEEEWARALVKEVQLKIGLHGYETAVRFLMEEKWPKGARERDLLDLFYAHSLVTYYQAYSWEINQREKVASKGVDLKAWTKDEIFAEAQRAFLRVWDDRGDLGHASIASWKEYLYPNDYPAGVRDTMRDAVAYLFVNLLADTSFWTPAQSNEIYRLGLKRLLSPPENGWPQLKEEQDDLASPSIHPLSKICLLLDDLGAWHATRGDRAAELEAYLEKITLLHDNFSAEQDRKLVRDDLAARLPRFRQVSWYSMGAAKLAEFTEEEEAPGALVRALAIANEGHEAYPGSPGGARCLNIAKQIEAPSYEMAAMKSDAPSKRSILVTHRNIGALYFRAYKVDLLSRIASARDYNLLPRWDEVRRLLSSAKPEASWGVTLPPTPDYRDHQTYVTPAPLKPGFYVVAASAKEDFGNVHNRIRAANILVGDLVIITRQDNDGGIEAQVQSGESGRPAGGAQVVLYAWNWQSGHSPVETKVTGDDGTVTFQPKGEQGGSYFILARKGGDFALNSNYIGIYRPEPPSQQAASLIYTDRSIYRPGQKLYWKVLCYQGRPDLGKYEVTPNSSVAVTLFDINGQKAAEALVTTNAYGSASGEFMIPAGKPLGEWRLSSSANGSAQVKIEEYKRPTFEAAIQASKTPMRLNRPATLTGEAKYYFGLPVTNGSVVWRVTREPVYPWWWGWYGWGGRSEAQTIASGDAKLKEDGTFDVTFTPEADEREASSSGTTYRYKLSADVTDEGGETRTATKSFRLGFVSVEASLVPESGFARENEKMDFKVSRENLDGNGRAGSGTWRLVALQEPEKALLPSEIPEAFPPAAEGAAAPYRTPGDAMRPRWDADYNVDAVLHSWKEGAEKGKGEVTCDDKGAGNISLPTLSQGAYRLIYETKDDFGATCKTEKEFIVAAPKTDLALAAAFIAESDTVTVGSQARFLVHSGLKDQPMLFELYRDGKLVERRRLESGSSNDIIEVPVAEKDRGGFAAKLTLLRDHQLISLSRNIFVPWDDKEMKVEFSTFRDKLRPGATETWRVLVKMPGGKPAEAGAAELLAYMYDKSLDLFAPHNPPSILSLYPSHAYAGSYQSTLGEAEVSYSDEWDFASVPGYSTFSGDRLKFYENYGIGGMGRRRYYGEGGVEGGVIMEKAAAPMALGAPPPAPAQAIAKDAAKSEPAKKTAPPSEAPAAGDQLRSNFAETAFWQPHLLTGKDGAALIEFTVPDSVTAWNVWVHAVTKGLKAGSLHKETRSVKELMVRPYMPRFFREGDKADLKVVVNDASDHELQGNVTLEIFDPETNENLAPAFGLPASVPPRPFAVKAGGGANVTFSLSAPARVGTVAFKVVAKAGDFSDGELRPLPVLPGRMHLAQSRFVTLRDGDKREMTFEDLKKNDDPTLINEQMVVTVDAQLFYGVLQALPYLVNYPYECTEQTMNRFLSTGILTSLYRDYPAVAKMAKEMSKRDTLYESFDDNDPNRKMTLEETPWLEEARGGSSQGLGMAKVLDPKIAEAQREASLAKLLKSQTSLGGFPWWAGGPPSPYMTLYIVYGFSKGLEFGVELPKEPVVRAFGYLHQHYLDECVRDMMAHDSGWEFVTFLNYVLSNYPDESWTGNVFTGAERKRMLDFSFKHWKQHSPYLKGLLALTLKRMGRLDDAKLVFDSVMDSATTTRDGGTSWAPEDRGWLWYNDTIETHAFALRTLMELYPKDPRCDGLVQWIFLNKKLNHWESTKATAEVLYSVAYYLKGTGALGVKEKIAVDAGPVKTTFDFDPDVYTGRKNQVVIPGEKIDPKTMSTITVAKEGKGFAFASATWHFSTEKLPEKGNGDLFSVERAYFKRVKAGDQVTLVPLNDGAALSVGDEVEVQLAFSSKHQAEYVHMRDPRPAGCEPVTFTSGYRWDLGLVRYEEVRDSGTNFFMEWVPEGQYTLKYRLRCAMAGVFRVGPATVQSMYAPEFNAYSAGNVITIEGQ